jgi:hypothetical protein
MRFDLDRNRSAEFGTDLDRPGWSESRCWAFDRLSKRGKSTGRGSRVAVRRAGIATHRRWGRCGDPPRLDAQRHRHLPCQRDASQTPASPPTLLLGCPVRDRQTGGKTERHRRDSGSCCRLPGEWRVAAADGAARSCDDCVALGLRTAVGSVLASVQGLGGRVRRHPRDRSAHRRRGAGGFGCSAGEDLVAVPRSGH